MVEKYASIPFMKILFCDNSLRELLNFRGDVISDYAEHGAEVVLLAPRNCDINDTSCAGVRTIPIDFNRSGMNPFKECRYFSDCGKFIVKSGRIISFIIRLNRISMGHWLHGYVVFLLRL